MFPIPRRKVVIVDSECRPALSGRAVARELGIPSSTFRDMVKAGIFPKPDVRKKWSRGLIDAWVDDPAKEDAENRMYIVQWRSRINALCFGAKFTAEILTDLRLPVEKAKSFNNGKFKDLTDEERDLIESYLPPDRRLEFDMVDLDVKASVAPI